MKNTSSNKKNTTHEELLLNAPMYKVIPRMAIPTVVAFVINAIYSLADTYFVSSLGTNATAAVSVNSSLDMLIFMMGSLFAIGSNSYIARLLGAGNKEKSNQVMSVAFFSALTFGLLLEIFGSIFMTPLVRLLGATDTCLQYSQDYAQYVLLAAPFMATSFVMNQCLRAEGSAVLSMIGMGIGGVLNCFLDPIFIFGLGLGVKGASLATAVSKFIGFCILIYPYLRKKTIVRLSIFNFKPTFEIYKEIIAVGLSSFFRSMLMVTAGILLNQIAGKISDSVLAGIGVTQKIMIFPVNILLGYASGFQPVAGFNWGAGQYKRVEESYRFASRTGICISIIISAIGIIFAPEIISLFSSSDTEMMKTGVMSMRLQCLALTFHCWVIFVNSLCAGIGEAKSAFILATTRQGSCFLPILYPATHFFGAYGVASVQAIADILSVFVTLPVYRRTIALIHTKQKINGEI